VLLERATPLAAADAIEGLDLWARDARSVVPAEHRAALPERRPPPDGDPHPRGPRVASDAGAEDLQGFEEGRNVWARVVVTPTAEDRGMLGAIVAMGGDGSLRPSDESRRKWGWKIGCTGMPLVLGWSAGRHSGSGRTEDPKQRTILAKLRADMRERKKERGRRERVKRAPGKFG
jgi:hypothetical protein